MLFKWIAGLVLIFMSNFVFASEIETIPTYSCKVILNSWSLFDDINAVLGERGGRLCIVMINDKVVKEELCFNKDEGVAGSLEVSLLNQGILKKAAQSVSCQKE